MRARSFSGSLVLVVSLMVAFVMPAMAAGQPTIAPATSSVTGTWKATLKLHHMGTQHITYVFVQSGTQVTGTASTGSYTVTLSGQLTGNVLTFAYGMGRDSSYSLTGTLSSNGRALAGKVSFWTVGATSKGTWKAKKVAAPQALPIAGHWLAVLHLPKVGQQQFVYHFTQHGAKIGGLAITKDYTVTLTGRYANGVLTFHYPYGKDSTYTLTGTIKSGILVGSVHYWSVGTVSDGGWYANRVKCAPVCDASGDTTSR